MFEAARVADVISHTSALAGFVAGVVLGIALVAAVAFATFTCGFGVALLARLLAGLGAQALMGLGEAIVKMFSSPCGAINVGSRVVFADGLPRGHGRARHRLLRQGPSPGAHRRGLHATSWAASRTRPIRWQPVGARRSGARRWVETEYRYHLMSERRLETVLPDVSTWRAEYDPAGRLLAETDPLGRATRHELGEDGLPKARVDARGKRQELEWNRRGQVVAHIDCSQKTMRYHYDADGRLSAITNALGERTRYERQATGEVVALYKRWREDDLDIGSGAVEGAARDLVRVRLDGPGMRWGRERAERVLHLRWETGICTRYRFTIHDARAIDGFEL